MRTTVDKTNWRYTVGVPVLIGTGIGAVCCLLLLLLMAAILTSLDHPLEAVRPMALVAGGIGSLLGGLFAGVLGRSRGLLLGALTGVALVALLLLVGAAMLPSVPFGQQLAKVLLMVVCSLIGGVLGVNLRRR